MPRRAHHLATISGIVALLVYTISLANGVGVDDSGELMAAACEPGIVHPPGYPLLTLLGHALASLPLGDVGIRLNLLSAIFGALATWLVSRAVAITTKSVAAVVFTAGLWIFAPLIWSWSTVMEVFALNSFFTALLLNLNLQMQHKPSKMILFAWFGVLGLGLSNQLTILFWVPIGGLWLLWADYKLFLRPQIVLGIIICLGLGLLPYAYLPIADSWRPQVAWGDMSSLTGIIRHIARVEFGPMSMANTSLSAGDTFVSNLKFFLTSQAENLLFLGVIPVCSALAWWRRSDGRPLAISATFIAIAWLFYAVVFQYLANVDIKHSLYLRMLSRFWPQPFLYLAVLSGFGFALLTGLSKRSNLALGLALLIGCLQAWHGNRKRIVDASELYTVIGSSALAAIEANALVITQGDFHYNILAYLKHCRGIRQDIDIVRQEILPATWARRFLTSRKQPLLAQAATASENSTVSPAISLGEVFRYNLPRRPVYMADDQLFLQSQGPYVLIPTPLLFRVRASDDPLWAQDVIRSTEHFPAMTEALKHNREILADPWPMLIEDTVWISRANFGQFLLELGRDTRRSPEERRLALEYAGQALSDVTRNWTRAAPGVWKNLGLYYYIKQSTEPKFIPETIRAWQHYLDQIPADAGDRAEITRILEALKQNQ